MIVRWFDQTSTDLPNQDDWLSAAELLHLRRLHVPKRRGDWRLGRWTAKQAIATHLELPRSDEDLRKIEILPDRSGAPQVRLVNQSDPVSISLSHRECRAACVVTSAEVAMGCDLELIEPRSDAFIADYFTAEEQAAIARVQTAHRSLLVTALWSTKESALKALRLGLRVDTRSVAISASNSELFDPISDGWHTIRAQYEQNVLIYGWWQASDQFVKSVMSTSAYLRLRVE